MQDDRRVSVDEQAPVIDVILIGAGLSGIGAACQLLVPSPGTETRRSSTVAPS